MNTEQQAFIEQVRANNLIDKNHVCYPYFRFLDDGTLIFINKLAFTWGLHIGPTHCDAYTFRFCFPSFDDAVHAFKEMKTKWDVPTFGWVAVRPEGRLPLPKEFCAVTGARQLEITPAEFYQRLDDKTVDQLIDDDLYSIAQFDKWIKMQEKYYPNFRLDEGVQAFYNYISKKEMLNEATSRPIDFT